MCFFCLDQEYVSQRGSSHSNCPVKDKKQFWTCTGNGCRLHFWICDNKDHVNLNNFKFERTKRYWRGRGVTFGNFTAIFQINSPQTMEQITPENSQTTSPPTAQIQFKELRSLEDATESLKKTAKGTDIVEVTEGDPLFLFSYAVGKRNPVNVFYDKGCSHVLFKEGIPEKELDAVKTKKGPLMEIRKLR